MIIDRLVRAYERLPEPPETLRVILKAFYHAPMTECLRERKTAQPHTHARTSTISDSYERYVKQVVPDLHYSIDYTDFGHAFMSNDGSGTTLN